MAKKGRKPTKERKGYFYEKEEEAIVNYIKSDNEEEKNKIFNEILYPAFTKMIESIIRRYKLHVPEEEFVQTFGDTASYLMSKINNFNPEKGYKAYSYCGTICKNYLIYRNVQYVKERDRTTPYDTVSDTYEQENIYETETETFRDISENLIQDTSKEIKEMVTNPERYSLSESEVKVGKALVELLDNWEDVLNFDGSKKLQKSSVLYFLREATMMDTKTVRDNMKPYKKLYYLLKKEMLS